MPAARRGAGRTGRRCRGGDLVAALDGNWAEVGNGVGIKVKAQAQSRGVELSSADVERATRDSIRALMLIRAYRARGHFHANLDPLGLEPVKNEEELDPRTYGFGEADLDRPIFLDKVLGLEFGTIRQIVAILRRTYCQTLGVEFLHISDRRPERLDPGAHRGARQGDHASPARASAPSSTSWSRPKASKNSAT